MHAVWRNVQTSQNHQATPSLTARMHSTMSAFALFRHPDGYAESEMGTNRMLGRRSRRLRRKIAGHNCKIVWPQEQDRRPKSKIGGPGEKISRPENDQRPRPRSRPRAKA